MQGLWELDQALFRSVHIGWHRDWLDPVFWVISSSGLGWVQILLILSLLPWKRAFQDAPAGILRILKMPLRLRRPDWRDLVGPLLLAYTFSSIFNTGILKRVIGRERPSNFDWAIPQEGFYHNAFPSGHTATSFGLATMLMFLTWETPKRWVGWAALAWAVLVGFSRVYRGVHWPSDVAGGALVGAGSACLAVIVLERLRRGADGRGPDEHGPERNQPGDQAAE